MTETSPQCVDEGVEMGKPSQARRRFRARSNDKVERLRDVPVLADLSEDEVTHLAALANVVDDQPPGARLIEQGQRARAAFLILEGEVRVLRDGHELTVLGPGEFVGEMASIDSEPRSADAITVGPTRLLVFHPRALDELMGTNGQVAHRLLQQIAQRLRSGR